MSAIALVTYAAAPALSADDQLLAGALQTLGASTHAVPWDDPKADWSSYDLVVLRSAWDYHLRAEEFDRWLDELERDGVRLVNPYPVVRWNGDKRYLIELARAGVAVVPTEVVSPAPVGPGAAGTRSSRETLEQILQRNGWQDAVVKPVVSASGHATWRTSVGEATGHEGRFQELVAASPAGVLVQPFVPAVVSEGEWSLVFIAGRYSHAAIKRPRGGEFRVQREHGGTYAPATAPPGLVADAERAIAAAAACAGVAPEELAYARVDGVSTESDTGARLLLMELECLEPNLFFLQAPEAARRMAEALMRQVLAPVRGSAYLR